IWVSSLSLLPITQPPRPSLLPVAPAATTVRTDLRHRCQSKAKSPAVLPRPAPAAGAPEPGRNRPLLPSIVFELSVRISPSFLHQIFRVRHQELGRSAVEVRGIHHRANYSFRAKGFEIVRQVKILG
ncbi:hypothetical protein Prudu_961S000200, partial [Prunus dulcis]